MVLCLTPLSRLSWSLRIWMWVRSTRCWWSNLLGVGPSMYKEKDWLQTDLLTSRCVLCEMKNMLCWIFRWNFTCAMCTKGGKLQCGLDKTPSQQLLSMCMTNRCHMKSIGRAWRQYIVHAERGSEKLREAFHIQKRKPQLNRDGGVYRSAILVECHNLILCWPIVRFITL